MDISVITPIYKGNKYIPGIMSMIQKNAHNAPKLDIELVLVNDSPDITLEVDDSKVDGFEITIINNEHNLGIHGARVQGIMAAQGKYIIMLDQDDEIVDDAILQQYNALDGRDAVISNGYAEDVSGNRKHLFKNGNKMRHVNDINYFFYFGNIIASPGLVLIKKSCIPSAWTENIMQINGADDWLLWVYMLIKGTIFSINPKVLYIHKETNENTSNDNVKMLKSNKEALNILQDDRELFSDKLLAVYARRLQMREKQIMKNGIFKKIVLYLHNMDIAMYVYKHNI